MPPKNALRDALNAANTGQNFPALTLVRDNPQIAAVVSKMVTPQQAAGRDQKGNFLPQVPNSNMFRTEAEHIAQNRVDNETVMQVHPDMELAAQVLISSILSPNDMMSGELTYSVVDGIIPADISAACLAEMKQHFDQVYKIQPQLAKILRESLFCSGSYPVAVIPENTIDEVINGSQVVTMESLKDTIDKNGNIYSLGILGPSKKDDEETSQSFGISLEHFSENSFNNRPQDISHVVLEGISESYLSVTDNFDALKMPEVAQRLREQKLSKIIKTRAPAFESYDDLGKKPGQTQISDFSLMNKIYKNRNYTYKAIASLKTQDQLTRRTVGHPLVLHLPAESVIPVYVPGNVEKQIGFFVLLDQDGHPIKHSADTDYHQQLATRLNSNGNFASSMLTKVKSMTEGFDPSNREHLSFVSKTYGEMVEMDLLNRLKNGIYGKEVEIGKNDEVYRIMLARALSKQNTQILFIPSELLTYFAFKFTPTGVGKSLLDDMKVLNSLRAMVMFANVMSSLKNSIGRTEVKLKLDEHDPNPQKTIEIAMHEIVRSRQQYFPLGINSPTDLVDWLQRSGFEFTFEGHPGIPDVAIDFGEKSTNFVKPDTELEDYLRKRAIMATGLSPETIDASFQAEFATSVVANNLLLAKRVMGYQEQFAPLLSDHLRKYILNSGELIGKIQKIISSNFEKLEKMFEEDLGTSADREISKNMIVGSLTKQFIMNFEVTLPKPNSVTLKNQTDALNEYSEALDKALDAIISDKFFTSDVVGDVANQVQTIKEIVKAYYLRQWMSENGVLPELNALTTEIDGRPSLDIWQSQTDHMGNLAKTIGHFLGSLVPVKEASNEVANAMGGIDESRTSSSSDNTSDGSGGGEDDLFGTGDDLFGSPAEEVPDANAATGSETTEPTDKPAEDKSLNADAE